VCFWCRCEGWVCLWNMRVLPCVNCWQHPQRQSAGFAQLMYLTQLGACSAAGGRSFRAALAGAGHQQRLCVPVGCEVLAVRQQLAAPATVRRAFAACCAVSRCVHVWWFLCRCEAGCACGMCASCCASTAGSTRKGEVWVLQVQVAYRTGQCRTRSWPPV
jgi:hypothetical protein